MKLALTIAKLIYKIMIFSLYFCEFILPKQLFERSKGGALTMGFMYKMAPPEYNDNIFSIRAGMGIVFQKSLQEKQGF